MGEDQRRAEKGREGQMRKGKKRPGEWTREEEGGEEEGDRDSEIGEEVREEGEGEIRAEGEIEEGDGDKGETRIMKGWKGKAATIWGLEFGALHSLNGPDSEQEVSPDIFLFELTRLSFK